MLHCIRKPFDYDLLFNDFSMLDAIVNSNYVFIWIIFTILMQNDEQSSILLAIRLPSFLSLE